MSRPAIEGVTRSLVITHEHAFFDARTSVLDLCPGDGRRILSIPSQLGCPVGCRFCISGTSPKVRNLRAEEMTELVHRCLSETPAVAGAPLELSFTGEGEAALNHAQVNALVRTAHQQCWGITSVRYSFSGFAACRLLDKLDMDTFPTRLQFSLHAARQAVRDQLVPRSDSLGAIEALLHRLSAKVTGVDLNVVLQAGVNDGPQDLAALISWGAPDWRIVFNPLLGMVQETVASQTANFEAACLKGGRAVARYERIGREISRSGTYPLLRFRAV